MTFASNKNDNCWDAIYDLQSRSISPSTATRGHLTDLLAFLVRLDVYEPWFLLLCPK